MTKQGNQKLQNMLLCHFKFSFKEDKLNFHFIGTLRGNFTMMDLSVLLPL